MKIQALALGAALGFFAAITPSCGQQCTPASCAGCCGKDGKCVAKPNNTNNTTCGTSGNMCQDCTATAGSVCDSTTFACSVTGAGGGSATGGGSAAGGSAGTCDGCKLQNGSCQQRGSSRQNNNICGSNGEACKACTAPQVCDNGACIAPPKKVGDSCTTDVDCQGALGAGARCRNTTLAGNATYPSGFCTVVQCVDASGNDACPMGSACINLPRIFGEEESMCVPTDCGTSGTQGNCRMGYVCVGGQSTFCLPLNMVAQDATLDLGGVIGNACANSGACRAPTPNAPGAGGFCITEVLQLPDGGARLGRDGGIQQTGYTGGYCSRDCRIDADCDPTGADNDTIGICLPVSQTAASCFKSCLDPNLGQSTCRTGYVCDGLTLRDGGLYDVGTCEPRCDVPGASACRNPDGGAGTCNMTTGYCDLPNRIIPVRMDGGTDAGTATDAGMATDAGTTTDAGTATDAGTTTDAGSATDAGSSTVDAGSTTTDAGTSTTCPDGGAPVDGGC